MPQGLASVRQVARERKQEKFTALLHHLTINLLGDSFQSIKKDAAAGVDWMSWKEYEKGLEDRLRDLQERIHRGAYRAQPSRRVYIPKADGRQSKAIGCVSRQNDNVLIEQSRKVLLTGLTLGVAN